MCVCVCVCVCVYMCVCLCVWIQVNLSFSAALTRDSSSHSWLSPFLFVTLHSWSNTVKYTVCKHLTVEAIIIPSSEQNQMWRRVRSPSDGLVLPGAPLGPPHTTSGKSCFGGEPSGGFSGRNYMCVQTLSERICDFLPMSNYSFKLISAARQDCMVLV